MVDETLINLLKDVKNGKTDSYFDLSLKYAPLIDSLVVKYSRGGAYSKDDLRQEAEIALYSAACSYDLEQRKITFGLYAGICIRNRLITAIRRERKESIAFFGRSYEDGGFLFESDEKFLSVSDPADTAISAESYREMIQKIERCLTTYERRVFTLYLKGMSVGEISEETERERKSVENAICRIRSKIKKVLSDQSQRN